MVVVAVANTLTNALRTLDHRFFQLHRLLHSHGEGTDRRTLRKKEVPVSRPLLDQEVKAS